jgi:hypothetical protein
MPPHFGAPLVNTGLPGSKQNRNWPLGKSQHDDPGRASGAGGLSAELCYGA